MHYPARGSSPAVPAMVAEVPAMAERAAEVAAVPKTKADRHATAAIVPSRAVEKRRSNIRTPIVAVVIKRVVNYDNVPARIIVVVHINRFRPDRYAEPLPVGRLTRRRRERRRIAAIGLVGIHEPIVLIHRTSPIPVFVTPGIIAAAPAKPHNQGKKQDGKNNSSHFITFRPIFSPTILYAKSAAMARALCLLSQPELKLFSGKYLISMFEMRAFLGCRELKYVKFRKKSG